MPMSDELQPCCTFMSSEDHLSVKQAGENWRYPEGEVDGDVGVVAGGDLLASKAA